MRAREPVAAAAAAEVAVAESRVEGRDHSFHLSPVYKSLLVSTVLLFSEMYLFTSSIDSCILLRFCIYLTISSVDGGGIPEEEACGQAPFWAHRSIVRLIHLILERGKVRHEPIQTREHRDEITVKV
ncbi:hypothetical protein R1flu_005584 [Riccia fluitans]|uniref:Uncharacterized protein n=1 Tax=Riccia fluitans TaxID=41844 RepID=A0ABD1YUD6_9MARC